MAYSVKGSAIINDNRALLGVSTAGINTALYVGDVRIEDGIVEAVSGVVSFVGDGSRLTGVVTVSEGGGGEPPEFEGSLELTGALIVGAGITITGISTFNGDLDLQGNDITNGGVGNFDSLVVTNTTTLGTALSFTGGDSDEFVSGITTDLSESAGQNELVTAEGVTAYVASQIGGGSLLEIVADNDVQGEIDLANDEVFDLAGTAGEIVSNIGGVGFNTVTFSLSDELVLPGTVAVTGLATFNANVEFATGIGISFADDADGVLINSVGVSSILAEDAAAETRVVSEKAIKQFVDGVSAEVEANANLNIEIDGVNIGTIALADGALGINGTPNEIEVSELVGAGNTFVIGLPDSVEITSGLQVGAGLSFAGGTANEIATGITTDLAAIALDYDNTELPTAGTVKSYVDSQVSGNTNAETINTADNQDDAVYSVPFVSATGVGVSMYTDALQLNYKPDTGLLVAQDFNSLSDIRYKENVETIEGALAKVRELRGVEFDWKNTPGSSVGVIAQEVMEVYPQLVTEGEEKITVNYNGLTGLLIQAVKELTARVEELEGKA